MLIIFSIIPRIIKFSLPYSSIIFFLISSPTFSQKIINGNAKVIDGDTIHIGKNKIRLHGIDAPEKKQKCFISNSEWNCGKQSSLNLINIINQKKVMCMIIDQDKYKRDIGKCYNIDNININK